MHYHRLTNPFCKVNARGEKYICSCFYTGQQATDVAVHQFRQIVIYWGSVLSANSPF